VRLLIFVQFTIRPPCGGWAALVGGKQVGYFGYFTDAASAAAAAAAYTYMTAATGGAKNSLNRANSHSWPTSAHPPDKACR